MGAASVYIRVGAAGFAPVRATATPRGRRDDRTPHERRAGTVRSWHRGAMDELLRLPLRLAPNRVYRFYEGGVLMDRFRGLAEPEDTMFPEDWVGSATPAINPPEHTYEGEGLSTVEVGGRSLVIADLLAERPEDVAGPTIVERYGVSTALLVKLLDAGSRLPVHVHPTRDLAARIFDSQFGKAEAWYIVATQQIDGAPSPRVWLGFRDDVSPEQVRAWIESQDTEALRGAMNEIEVSPGDTVFVRPGLLHATGAGVFLVEAQEPTDFSIMAEYRGYPIDPEIAHMHRGWDTMLQVIDRGAVTQEELGVLCGAPRRVAANETEGWTEDDIWGPQSDPYFKAFRLHVDGSVAWPHAGVYSVNIVTAGSGMAETAHGTLELRAGDTFTILGGTAPTTISGNLELVVTTPSFV
jgi:mannose-6-phosphate isomerase